MIMKNESRLWTVLSVYAIFAFIITMMLASCGTSRSCHTKGYYVSKSVKKAQAKPNAH